MSWRLAFFFGIFLVAELSAAQYQAIETLHTGPEIIGACGKPLPLDRSRQARGSRLLCGGTQVNFDRRPVKSPFWNEWSVLERSDASGALTTRRQMQELRLRDEPIKWSGQSQIKTYETWSWFVRKRGKNPDKCRVWTRQVPCTKTRQIPITRRVCTDEDDSENFGGASGFGPGGAGTNSGSGSQPRSGGAAKDSSTKRSDPWAKDSGRSREQGPSTGPKMDSNRQRESYDSYKGSKQKSGGGGTSSGGGSKSGGSSSGSGKSNRRSWIREFSLFPKAVAETCSNRVVDYREESYQSTCDERVVDECEWEEEQFEMEYCSTESVSYSVEYEKPNGEWAPGKPGYHDLLPNKYDLLPGEWEVVHLLLNNGNNDGGLDKSLARKSLGRASLIKPSVEFESKGMEDQGWNKYRVSFDQSEIQCRMNTSVVINAKIATEERIVRKAPNALAIPIDRLGREEALRATEKFLDGDQKVRLRPYKVQLEDSSNDLMLTAARQSRKFKDLDEGAVTTDHPNGEEVLTARDLGFWKNTLLKVRLIEKNSCFLEGDKLFADVLDTTSSLTKAEGNRLVIQLDGEQSGVPSFYRPFGFIGKFLGFFMGEGGIDLYPTPGKHYEFHVSMLQQGLPFYENGCLNGAKTCEKADANPQMYSDDLKIEFYAEPGYDERGWLQKFENWYGRKPWNKFFDCN
jgi:hypothetical protein